MVMFPCEMATSMISFSVLGLTLNYVKFICHSYFSVLIIGICQSTNSFVSLSLPLCTQTKWAPITVIICFRKTISIHRIELRLEASQLKRELLKDRSWNSGLALGWPEKECCQRNELGQLIFCKILRAVAKCFTFMSFEPLV